VSQKRVFTLWDWSFFFWLIDFNNWLQVLYFTNCWFSLFCIFLLRNVPKWRQVKSNNNAITWVVWGNSRLKTWHRLETREDSDAKDHSNHRTGDGVTSDEIWIQEIPVCSKTCNSGHHTLTFVICIKYFHSLHS